MRKKLLVLGMIVGLTGLVATRASAATITYVTPPGATTSGPVSASATFVTGADQLTITLEDLLANPTSVAQLPSDLFFTVSGDLTSGSLSSSHGTEITVNGDGTWVGGSTVDTGWLLSSIGSTFHLDDLNGGAGPKHTIIGPPDGGGLYSSANGSIAGNGPHNPFLDQTATFVLNIPGMTADTTVTGATFSFGTVSGVDVPGTPPVPEPASMLLFGLGLMGGARRFARSRRS